MHMKHMRTHQGGFSMIEVLIAIVVLAIGLLGFALLQTMNLRYTQSANSRTIATNLAYSLLDQMRTNRLSAAQYAASASFATNELTEADCTTLGTDSVSKGIANWKCQVLGTLGPSTAAVVNYNAAGMVSIELTWGERTNVTSEASTRFVVSSQL